MFASSSSASVASYGKAPSRLALGSVICRCPSSAGRLTRRSHAKRSTARTWAVLGLAPMFTTRTGRPVEPRNLVRSFRRICDDSGIRAITVHQVRHTVASLLKVLGVPARDAQIILGHSRLAVTLEVYTHTDEDAKLDALLRLHDLFVN